jgi:hypothetical protein
MFVAAHALPRRGSMYAHRIPYLKLNLLRIDVDHAGSKLDANGQVMNGLEALVCELQQEAGFANTCTPY